MNEAELIRRSQEGDGEAFHALLERHRQVLFGTAYLLTRDSHRAEDLVQEALIRIWRGLPTLRSGGSFKAWVMRVLVNEAMSMHRKKRVEQTQMDDALLMPEDGAEVENEVLREEERQALQRGLERLGEDHRQVVVLHYYAELSIPEIARTLGCREGTVKSRLHRALRHLGGVLKADGWQQGLERA